MCILYNLEIIYLSIFYISIYPYVYNLEIIYLSIYPSIFYKSNYLSMYMCIIQRLFRRKIVKYIFIINISTIFPPTSLSLLNSLPLSVILSLSLFFPSFSFSLSLCRSISVSFSIFMSLSLSLPLSLPLFLVYLSLSSLQSLSLYDIYICLSLFVYQLYINFLQK